MSPAPEMKWADELQSLLEEGATALRSGKAKSVAAAQTKLRKFTERTPASVDTLDRQARLAIMQLDVSNTKRSLEKLEQRSEEVRRISKLIGAVTSQAKKDASTLRLEKAKALIDQATSTIQTLRDFKDTLKNKPGDKQLAEDVKKVIGEFQKLRNKIENPD